jgi:outer membrane protein assembly factor BamB
VKPARALCALLAGSALMLAGCGMQAAVTKDIPAGRGGKHFKTSRAPGADWPTFDYDAARSGVGPARTGIAAGNLGELGVRVVHLGGTVDAAPIELHGIVVRGRRRDVVVVTTTYGRTIAVDPGTGQHLWQFTPGDIRAYAGSAQVTTATPVADPDRRYVYAPSPDGIIHKLSLASGREVRSGHWPARITFDASHEKIASALSISGGWVVVETGGYIGDAPTYQGHVVLIDRGSGAIAHVFNTLCSNRRSLIAPRSCRSSDSAIWAREGAVIEPGSRRILIATGNAPFNGSTDWGDSVLELSADATRLLHNWTPRDQAQLGNSDTDLGSTAPALLPGGLIAQGGKAGVVSLIDLNRLGPAGPHTGGELQDISTPGSSEVLTAPVVWSHRGQPYLFVADDSGTTAYVLQGRRLHVRWQNGTSGTSPVLAGGLLYVFDPGGTLDVYAPATGRRLASLPASSGHWNSPIVAGGRIILPVGSYHSQSTQGTLLIYHLHGR